MGSRIARKLTVKEVTGMNANELAKIGRNERRVLFYLWGTAGGEEMVQTTYGESYRLNGQFYARKADATNSDGDVYGGVVYLPPFLHANIASGLRSGAVDFSVAIGVEPDDSPNNRFGYRYFAETFLDPRQSDTYQRLAKTLPPLAIEDKSKGK